MGEVLSLDSRSFPSFYVHSRIVYVFLLVTCRKSDPTRSLWANSCKGTLIEADIICVDLRLSAVGFPPSSSRQFVACPTKPSRVPVVGLWAGEVGSIRGLFV